MSADSEYLPTCVPLPLKKEELKEVVEKCKDWALMHGVAMRSKQNFSSDMLQFAPFILLPSTFLREDFEKVAKLQTSFNELVHKVAHDKEFLSECLKETIKVDEFTGKLFNIYETVEREGITQPLSLGSLRSDWMLKNEIEKSNVSPVVFYPPCRWKQVEINTIAAGFGWLGPVSTEIHRYVLQELGYHEKLKNLPENKALSGLCQGMIEAWKLYAKSESVILFLIEDVTINICDQRFHEFEIRIQNPMVKVIRGTLTDIGQRAKLGLEKELLIDGNEVAVVYFRAGYEPAHYHGQLEWDARLLIERSKAIKCPTIQYHLAGTKKVQQELAKTGAVERFIKDPEKVKAVRNCFVGLYGLDFDKNGDKAVQMAIEDPERFVLKPQREGGGNNVYGTEVKNAILKMKDGKERTAWILMERIWPPVIKGYMIRPGGADPPQLTEMVSELGIYGVVIGDSQSIKINRQVGHMLRTKISTANEGGVAAGLGALDSPYLID